MTAAEQLAPIADSIPAWRTEVSFSVTDKKQVEEAKTLYRRAKLYKRIITVNGNEAFNFRTILEQGTMHIEAEGHGDLNLLALHVIDKTGDRRPIWRMDDPEQVKLAAEMFDEYIKKGWKAYAVHRLDPKLKGVRVYSFDPALEEVIFDDQTIEDKLKNFAQAIVTKAEEKKTTISQKLKKFAEQFDEIKLLPKTTPG